jgi:hypothetical protein
MENNVDFRYDYSDLNTLCIRTEILTGDYAGIILEYGRTNLIVSNKSGKLVFDYTLYAIPERFNGVTLRGNEKFEQHLADVLVAVVADRNADPEYAEKLHRAQGRRGPFTCAIEIDSIFYTKQTANEENAEPQTGE